MKIENENKPECVGEPCEVCGCGRMLYEYLDVNGKRIGITHYPIEDEDGCLNYWRSLKPVLIYKN